ncbi:MAG: sugar nucleotide-binding protein [Anaerolineae bacterium]|nr:sugar nucleotide-binding protein [Anaerolineae bacterium]MDW8298971.1 sugar nucleotide-binding protein [Anaerolineae bacterium]
MKRLLITGGSGDLGRELCRQASAKGYEVTATYLTRPQRLRAGTPLQLDLNDPEAVKAAIDQVQPHAIIHTAVPPMNAPNLRAQIVASAYHLRTFCPRETKLVFLSTDMIFDGTQPPYADDAPPSPLSAYGQAKAEMELMADHVVRTSLIYDFERGNKQTDWMLEKISRGETLRLYEDEFRSAIWVVNLAEAILELIENPFFQGTLNVAAPSAVSRLALGTKLLEALGIVGANVEAVSSALTGRPANLTLDVSKAQLLLRTPLLSLEEAFARWREYTTERQ